MRASVAVLLIAFLAAAFASPDGRWINRTIESLPSSGDLTDFAFYYRAVPAMSSPYYLEVELTFAEVYDEIVVDFTASGHSFQYIVKEKGIKQVIVFQNMIQSTNGWSADDIRCGSLAGSVQSKSKIASISAALKILRPARLARDQVCGRDVDHPRRHHARRVHVMVLPVLLLALAAICCCCCCMRALARRRCRRACKPVHDQYPADVIVAASEPATEQQVPEASFATEETPAGYQMYSFPVMAVPIEGVQYALVPTNQINN